MNNQIKCVAVGDASVGKTSLLKSYATHKFSREHTPTIFDNYLVDVMVNGEICHLGLFDTASHENYDKLRPMSYSQANIVLICYSVVKPSSFRSITEKWVPELHFFANKTPFILVGTQTDLRSEMEINLNSNSPAKFERHDTVSRKQGKKLSKELSKYCNCIGHVECSALTQQGLKTVFDEVIRSATSRSKDKMKGKGKCYVL
eukprot:TRINITY_DN2777_c2_g1_i1.p1 TRINITY_DN2777_c2_g1~~TRINITY_DN2777_c2_g1_i1.p1  ORF type:complete len:203 (+),score=24.38 TRINITY_DN2777_c2_g1_i1:331-939(+)